MAKRTIDSWRFRLTAEEFRALIDYHPETGEFWTRPRKIGSIQLFGRRRTPAVTLTIQEHDGKWRKRYGHQLAWLWMTGAWPPDEVDHINNVSTDNRWVNLRLGTHQENNWNKDFSKLTRNPLGLLGANLHKSGLWRATFKRKTLGYFKTAQEAHEAYKKAAIETYGEFAHTSIQTKPKPQDQ